VYEDLADLVCAQPCRDPSAQLSLSTLLQNTRDEACGAANYYSGQRE
jgi:hypothetical protein